MKKKFRSPFKILSIFLIIVFLFLTPILIQKLIRINSIECSTQYGSCTQEFKLGDYKTVKKQIEKQLSEDIQVNNYIISYKIPSTLKIELNLKKPKYAIRNISNNYYLIAIDGVVIRSTNESNLLLVVRNDALYNLGDKVLETDKFALDLIEKVSWNNPIEQNVIENNILKITLKDRILVLFPLEGDSDVLSGSLRLIISRLNDGTEGIRMEDIQEIDLRFKNPVIR